MINISHPSSLGDNPLPTESRSYEVLDELRSLLIIPPPKRPPEWQHSVGSLIGLIGADFSKQDNPEIAFTEIVLIALAAQKGSKEAKKRALKPIRWISTPPPSISEIFSGIEEARAAIRVLQPLRTNWIERYVSFELAKNKWPGQMAPFVEWLLNSTPSAETFIRELNLGIKGSHGSSDQEWISDVLESATKIIGKSPISAGSGVMSEIVELASILESRAAKDAATGGLISLQKVRSRLVGFLNQLASAEPSVLVQGAIVAALGRLCPSPLSKKTSSSTELDSLCRRTISILSVLMPAADEIQRAHYRNIWSTYRNISSKADQLLKNTTREYPILGMLTSSPHELTASNDLGVTAGLESVLCELTVNWDDYYLLHSDDPAAQQLAARIDDLNTQLGIIRFGRVGEQVAYDPVLHHLGN